MVDTEAKPTVWPVGTELRLSVDALAHGGHCVARHEGRVVFVRHTLPGEEVLARITEDRGGSYCRADAIEVLSASPDRVEAPCSYAAPGACGGCDWQHVAPSAQRLGKAAVVREQLLRLGGLDDETLTGLGLGPDAAAEELPGGMLGWRTRVGFAVSASGDAGLRPHRGQDVLDIDDCQLASDAIRAMDVPGRRWADVDRVTAVASSAGDRAVVISAAKPDTDADGDPGGMTTVGGSAVRASGTSAAAANLPAEVAVLDGGHRPAQPIRGHARVREQAAGRTWQVPADAFWQVHPAAADTLATAVQSALAPKPGETVLDLYAGVGLFAGVLAAAVGNRGRAYAVESDRAAVAAARRNLRESTNVTVVPGRVESWLAGRAPRRTDLVVLDPPRAGAGSSVVRRIARLRPRAVAYVACDPAALARDVRTFGAAGYRLTALRVFDAFPMTHHIECVATFQR